MATVQPVVLQGEIRTTPVEGPASGGGLQVESIVTCGTIIQHYWEVKITCAVAISRLCAVIYARASESEVPAVRPWNCVGSSARESQSSCSYPEFVRGDQWHTLREELAGNRE
jgi:hypothetical protein